MAKPEFPQVEHIKEQYQKPSPSGICPSKAWIISLAWGMPIAIVLGIITHYVGYAIGWVALGISSIFISALCCGAPAIIIIALVAIFGYPILTGAINGIVTGSLAIKGKCRNPQRSGAMGLITGIVLYGSYLTFSYTVSNEITNSSKVIHVVDELGLGLAEGSPWLVWTLIALEFILVVGASLSLASSKITDNTYCEEHDDWYGNWTEKKLLFDMEKVIVSVLETQDVGGIDAIEPVTKDSYPHLLLKNRKCPAGDKCGIEITAEIYWQEATEKRGKTKYEEKNDIWFNIMLPSGFGKEFVNMLFADSG